MLNILILNLKQKKAFEVYNLKCLFLFVESNPKSEYEVEKRYSLIVYRLIKDIHNQKIIGKFYLSYTI